MDKQAIMQMIQPFMPDGIQNLQQGLKLQQLILAQGRSLPQSLEAIRPHIPQYIQLNQRV